MSDLKSIAKQVCLLNRLIELLMMQEETDDRKVAINFGTLQEWRNLHIKGELDLNLLKEHAWNHPLSQKAWADELVQVAWEFKVLYYEDDILKEIDSILDSIASKIDDKNLTQYIHVERIVRKYGRNLIGSTKKNKKIMLPLLEYIDTSLNAKQNLKGWQYDYFSSGETH